MEPVTLAEARAHLRIDHTDEDASILGLIATARAHVEDVTRRALMTQTWRLDLDAWPDGSAGDWWRMLMRDDCGAIRLPKPPVQEIVSVQYVAEGGTLATLDPTTYELVQSDVMPAAVSAYGQVWPAIRPVRGAVRVTFKAGYGDLPSAVPGPLRHAILLLVGHYHSNREAATPEPMTAAPYAVEALLSTYRMYLP